MAKRKLTLRQKKDKIKREILSDNISWRRIKTPNPNILAFEMYSKRKHTKGYGTIQLHIIDDGKDAFVYSDLTSGYYRSYKALKKNQGLKIGAEFTKTSIGGNISYIKVY